jgi:hypothetical protein
MLGGRGVEFGDAIGNAGLMAFTSFCPSTTLRAAIASIGVLGGTVCQIKLKGNFAECLQVMLSSLSAARSNW